MAVKFILRPLLRMFLQRYIRKMLEKNMGQFNRQYQQRQKPGQSRKEGSINIDIIPEDSRKKDKGKDDNDDDGEYIDYEEIK